MERSKQVEQLVPLKNKLNKQKTLKEQAYSIYAEGNMACTLKR